MNRFFKITVSLICCLSLIVFVSPLRVHALFSEGVMVGVGVIAAISAILIGLGVMPKPGYQAEWDGLVSSIASNLPSNYFDSNGDLFAYRYTAADPLISSFFFNRDLILDVWSGAIANQALFLPDATPVSVSNNFYIDPLGTSYEFSSSSPIKIICTYSVSGMTHRWMKFAVSDQRFTCSHHGSSFASELYAGLYMLHICTYDANKDLDGFPFDAPTFYSDTGYVVSSWAGVWDSAAAAFGQSCGSTVADEYDQGEYLGTDTVELPIISIDWDELQKQLPDPNPNDPSDEDPLIPWVPVGLPGIDGLLDDLWDKLLGLMQQDVWSGDTETGDPGSDPGTDPSPDAPSVEDPGSYAVDLKEFFPFCIPWDLYEFLNILAAEPRAPEFDWIIYYDSEEYKVHIDLSAWDSVASLFRTLELLGFIVGLAYVTRQKYIRG